MNPVQEFNRDLSVACITTWGQQTNDAKKKKWAAAQERRAKKGEKGGKSKKQKSAHCFCYMRYEPLNISVCQPLKLDRM